MKEQDFDTPDVVAITNADQGDIWLHTPFMKTDIIGGRPTGVRVLRWSNKVCLVAGTENNESKVTVGQTFSTEKARELAETINEAADLAEEHAGKTTRLSEDSERSFLRRLLG